MIINSQRQPDMSLYYLGGLILDFLKKSEAIPIDDLFMNIQKKFMERYGMDSEEVEKQLKNFGIDHSIAGMNNIDLNNISSENLESIKKSAGFYEKYGSKITPKSCITTYIKNDVNDIEIVIEQEKIMLLSSKKINLMDAELNEFLLAYKNMFNKKIKVVLCENYTGYDY